MSVQFYDSKKVRLFNYDNLAFESTLIHNLCVTAADIVGKKSADKQ